jgi:hypothetical protein
MKTRRDCALRSAGLVAMLVAAAGCGSAPVASPSVTVAPAGSLATSGPATASAPVPATPTAAEGLVAPPAALTDSKNDLADEDGHKAKSNPQIDLVRAEATADGTDLQVTMTMAGNVPAKISSNRQELNYVVEVEAKGAKTLDYWLIVTNLEGGAWYAALTDWGGNSAEEDNEFPGTFAVDKNQVTIRVPLAVLGSPTRLRMMAVTQRADHKSGKVVAEDQVPKGDQSVPTTSWLTLPPD